MDKLLTLQEAKSILNVSKSTLQRWDNSGKLIALRTEGGHRRYKLSDIKKCLVSLITKKKIIKRLQLRLTQDVQLPTKKTHGDIERQSMRLFEYCTKHKYKVEHIIKDMGSGLNDKRKGFTKLCNLVVNKKINKVIIEHKDRLTRFQYNLIEFFFNSYGVEIELLDKKEYTEQEELVNDMMMLIASFSGRLYSARAKENRKKLKNNKDQ